MQKLAAVKTVEKKSQFYAYLYKIIQSEDINQILKEQRKKYKKANHHCYAIIHKNNEISKDDGEVGHPGKILLEILKKHNLNSHVLIVTRVFGGIKLGVGGVSRAFKEAGESVINYYQNTK